MSPLLKGERKDRDGKERVRTWAGVVEGDTQAWGLHDRSLAPLDDDQEFLNSLFDDILNDPLGMEPTAEKQQVTKVGLESIQMSELATYMHNSSFRSMISDCPIFDRVVDAGGIRELMEKAKMDLNKQDINCAKVMMRNTLQSYSSQALTAKASRVKQKNLLSLADKVLLDAESPNVLDILHRPSTSTEHVDMNVEAVFQSPLTDLCDLKLTLSPHLGHMPCHSL